MVGPGTASSVGSAIRAWWRLVMDEPAAMLVVVLMFGISVGGAAWLIDHFFVTRSEYSLQMEHIGNKISSQLDKISCEVQWNRYTTQEQNLRVQERALVAQIQAQKRYLTRQDGSATNHDREVYDSLTTQLTYVRREEKTVAVPQCDFPFRG